MVIITLLQQQRKLVTTARCHSTAIRVMNGHSYYSMCTHTHTHTYMSCHVMVWLIVVKRDIIIHYNT